jgi:hypothetical protein
MAKRISLYTVRKITQTVQEGISEDAFTRLMQEHKPKEIFCEGWHTTPVLTITRHTKTGCKFVWSAAADKTPYWVPYKLLWSKLRHGGLSSAYIKEAKP